MGLGSFGLGTGVLGADPVYVSAAVAGPVFPRALLYDPRLRQFVLLDPITGNAIDVHPVDQIVAIRCTTYEGQVGSDPTLGHRLRTITSGMTQQKAQQAAEAEFNRILADLVQAGDISIQSVVADVSVYSRGQFAITYVNLRDPRNALRYPATETTTVNIA